MTSATIAPHTLAIDGMSGDTCVKRVADALKGVNGVTTQSVKVGSAKIESDDAGCRDACSAINRSGYKARENPATTSDADIKLAPEVPSAEHSGRNMSGTPIMAPSGEKLGSPNDSTKADHRANIAKAAPQTKPS